MRKQNWIMVLLAAVFFAGYAHGYTMEEVVQRGFLQCGVSTGSPGFSSIDADGRWTGLDVDICRAVAAATLGDAEKVEFLPLAERESFTALLSGAVDILSRHSTWTFTRESALAVHFAGISYYDGQGLLLSKKLNVNRLSDLRKVRVCSPVGSDFELNLIDYFERNEVDYKIVPYETLDLAVNGFKKETCDLVSMQQSQLYGIQMGLVDPGSAVVLPEVIGKEPLGSVVRQDDDTWLNIVKWSLYAMINAEELGVTSANVEEMRYSNILAVKRLVGRNGTGGKGIGLEDDWAVQIIRQVGNYGEIFEKHFGSRSALKIERGMNNLWNQGGLQYAPPLQ
ncbi:MAG: amino acid ABC transporter substrate-binding protein [Desulforhopalus sp.]